jgi:hypothetical protein
MKNTVYYPANGYVCGVSCDADVAKALMETALAGNPLVFPAKLAATTCGAAYGIVAVGGAVSGPGTLMAGMISSLSAPRQCGVCVTSGLNQDFFASASGLLHTLFPHIVDVTPVQSKMTICDTTVIASAWIFVDPNADEFPANPDLCGEESDADSASTLSIVSALLFVVSFIVFRH